MQVRKQSYEESLLSKLLVVATALEREAERELKVSFGLTFSQFRVLSMLKRVESVSQQRLAEAIGVTPAVVTRQADVLVARGLMSQTQSPNSKREKLVAITPRGKQAVDEATVLVESRLNPLMHSLSLKDETQFHQIIEQLAGQVAKLSDNQPD